MNSVTDEKFKVQLLINLLGLSASVKAMNAFLPKDYMEEKSLAVIAKCKKLFGGERNAIVEHYAFCSHSQKKRRIT